MAINLRYDPTLGAQVIPSQTFLVADNATTCGTAPSATAFSTWTIPTSVWNFLGTCPSYSRTIQGLYNLANDALGQNVACSSAPSYGDINNAMNAVNLAFDNCKFIAVAPQGPSSPVGPDAQPSASEAFNVDVNIAPNPFVSMTTISFTSESDVKEMTVEIYNMMGQKVTELFKGYVNANENVIVTFTPKESDSQGMYYVVIRSESGKTVNRIIRVK
jgi:hypothetical protein